MKTSVLASIAAATLLLAACDLRDALLGFPQPKAFVTGEMPVELVYREAKGGLVILLQVEFGALALTQLTAVVIPEKAMPCREKFDEIGFGGVIGADLMKQFVVEIDPVAQRVRLHDPKTWRAPGNATAFPITFRQGHPFVEARVTLADGRVIEVASPVYSSDPNAVDGSRTSTIGIGSSRTGGSSSTIPAAAWCSASAIA